MGQRLSLSRRKSKVETQMNSNSNCAIILPSPRKSNNVLQTLKESEHENHATMKNNSNIHELGNQFQLDSLPHYVVISPTLMVSVAISTAIETVNVGIQIDAFAEQNSSSIMDSGYDSSWYSYTKTQNIDEEEDKTESLAEFEMLEFLIEESFRRRRLRRGKQNDSKKSVQSPSLVSIQRSIIPNDLPLLPDVHPSIEPVTPVQCLKANVPSVYQFWIPLKETCVFMRRIDRRIESIGRMSSCSIQLKHSFRSSPTGDSQQLVEITANNDACMSKCRSMLEDKFPEFWINSGRMMQ